MVTFFGLVQKENFRCFVSNRIAASTQESYAFPDVLPLLYRYRSLSSHAIDDIVNNKITLTAIGEFNDIYDGAIHQYGTMEEINAAAEAWWTEMETHRIAARLPDGLLRRDDIVKPYIEHLKTESRLKFRELDYLGTYVCCLSKDNSSTLMWAHYADSNRGICIEYDFNKLPNLNENLLWKTILPVAYTTNPIDVTDLLEKTGSSVYQYPLDAAVLCAALNKASIWQYEKEWRIVWVLASSLEKERRLTINSLICPSKIYLGYHFLKPFFFYIGNESDYKNSAGILKKFMELISFVQNNGIKVAVMTPSVGSYQMNPHDISIDDLYRFMLEHFRDGRPENMRYYYVVHDCLMDLIEETK